ncbi:MAG: DUF3108 domain-containing protein [Betaproteobacteria bacterium]|nr:DUF3108 domain-containing protein [Betaproteobacteria bacterium]
MKTFFWLLGLFGLLGLNYPAAAAPPRHIDATYSLTAAGQPVGIDQETFARSGNRYQIESISHAVGLLALFHKGNIKLTSVGTVTAFGLKPLRFEEDRGPDPRRALAAAFDWPTQTLTMRHDGKTERTRLPAGTQDRLSLMYQFLFMSHLGPTLRFAMTSGRSLEHYSYHLVGREQVATPAGTFETLHYAKDHAPGEHGFDVWLATTQDNFPVQLEMDQSNGMRLRQTITRLSIR